MINRCFFEFYDSYFFVKDKAIGRQLLSSHHHNRLYRFPFSTSLPSPSVHLYEMSSLSYWHHRLSHPALPIVSHILCRHCLSFMLDSPPFTYSAYPMGKAHQFSFPSFSYAQFEKSLELVWANIWGLAPYLSIMSFKYYLSIVDYFTRFT